MAEDTVDEVLDLSGSKAACRTRSCSCTGEDWDQVQPGPVTPATRDHLVGRYGAEAANVIQLVAEDASLGEPLVPGLGICGPRPCSPPATRWR